MQFLPFRCCLLLLLATLLKHLQPNSSLLLAFVRLFMLLIVCSWSPSVSSTCTEYLSRQIGGRNYALVSGVLSFWCKLTPCNGNSFSPLKRACGHFHSFSLSLSSITCFFPCQAVAPDANYVSPLPVAKLTKALNQK